MKMTFSGLEEVMKSLEKVSEEHLAGRALYEGAKVVADAMGKAVDSIPTEERAKKNGSPWWGTAEYPIRGVTPEQKDEIKGNYGIADFKSTGDGAQTSVGFNGYVTSEHASARYGGGRIPTGMLVQAVEDGTQFRQGIHTIRSTVENSKSDAEEAMQKQLDEDIERLT